MCMQDQCRDSRHSGTRCVCTPTRLSRLLEPALLLALLEAPRTHGYDLLNAVNDMGLADAEVDPGSVYRTLRQLEEDGYLVSSWDTAGPGPARRVYEVTQAGLELLELWANALQRRYTAIKNFLERYESVVKS
jgi:PadR family transcriptional regulator PadR